MLKKEPKISLKLCRSFSIGFTIHSPTLNGLSFEVYFGCFHVGVWGRGGNLIGFNNYWDG